MKERKINFRGKIAENAKKHVRGIGSSRYLNLPKGVALLNFEDTVRKVKLDFLPYEVTDSKHPDRDDKNGVAVPGSFWYTRPYLLHRNVGQKNNSYVCLTSVGKKCPICEYQSEMFKTDKAGAIKLYPKKRYLYVVIPIDSKKHDEIPYIWDMAESLFQETLDEELRENKDYEIFPNLEDGLTLALTIKWKSIGDGKSFPDIRNIEFEEREPYDEKILDEVPNLDEVLEILSYDELNSKFLELDDEDIDDNRESGRRSKKEDEDDEPRKKKSLTRRTSEADEETNKTLTWDELNEMSTRKLLRLCEDQKLRVDPEDYPEGDREDFVKAIAEELDIEIPRKSTRATRRDEEDKPRKSSRTQVEKESETPVRRSHNREKNSNRSDKKDKCPSGHKFGVDTDDYNECDSCDLWDECIEQKEKKK